MLSPTELQDHGLQLHVAGSFGNAKGEYRQGLRS